MKNKFTEILALLLCAALLLASAGCIPAIGVEAEPEEVDWETMEFDPEVVRERLLAAETPEPEQSPKEAALEAIAYYQGKSAEQRAERDRLAAELEEIKLIIALLKTEEPTLVAKYERLAETTESKLRRAEEEVSFAEEMIVNAEASIAEYDRATGESESVGEYEPEYAEDYIPPDADAPDADQPLTDDVAVQEPSAEPPFDVDELFPEPGELPSDVATELIPEYAPPEGQSGDMAQPGD